MEFEKKKLENIGLGNIKMLQDEEGFKFGIDAIVLADFANRFCPNAREVLDLGTGNGIIPLVISHKNKKCNIKGIDIQKKAIALAKYNAKYNNLDNRIEFKNADINEIKINYKSWQRNFDLVLSNPPYVARGGGISNEKTAKYIARHETTADLEKFIEVAAWTLRDKGHFCMINRPSRLVDIFYCCRKYKIEPKEIRMILPKENSEANIVLVHGILGGGSELKVLNPLVVRDNNGCYTSEILDIYEKY